MKGKKVAIVYYDGFAPLDVFGPIQAMNCSCVLKNDGKPDPAQSLFEILSVGKDIGLVQSGEASTGPQIYCAYNFTTLPPVDIVLIPGGYGRNAVVSDPDFISKLKTLVYKTPIVLSVCTGAGILAKTTYLDGKVATSNKTAWDWVIAQSALVKWTCPPRWIDGIDKVKQTGYMTSAGVSAGIDMTLGLINTLFDPQIVNNAQDLMEYTWVDQPAYDPFAKLCRDC